MCMWDIWSITIDITYVQFGIQQERKNNKKNFQKSGRGFPKMW